MNAKINILFVCMGNICRSPLAEGVFQETIDQAGISAAEVWLDSAGTHAYHVGEPPDPRSQSIALQKGIDISQQRARKVKQSDYENFHYIVAMDDDNYQGLLRNCPPEYTDRIHLFLNFAPQLGQTDVPDPYYGGSYGFERVYDLVYDASQGLLEEISEKLNEELT